jgi:hypothetical protein
MLAKWPVLHSGIATTNDSFMAYRGSASWTNDGSAIVTRSGDVTVWDASSLPPDAAARVARAQHEIPWRVVDGRLQSAQRPNSAH